MQLGVAWAGGQSERYAAGRGGKGQGGTRDSIAR